MVVVERHRDRKALTTSPFTHRRLQVRCRHDAVVRAQVAHLSCEELRSQRGHDLAPWVALPRLDAVVEQREADAS